MPPPALDGVAKHRLGAAIVHRRREAEAALIGPPDRPAGERTRDVDDVFLGVAAVDAERVELEQLARVVFVQAARALRSVDAASRAFGAALCQLSR